MHGEFKVPKGKLVVVDLDLDMENDVIRNVRVSGDFFLYPEEALAPITASLEGAPAGRQEEVYRELVAAAVPRGTEMLGFSPRAVAVAVVRAQNATQEGAADGQ